MKVFVMFVVLVVVVGLVFVEILIWVIGFVLIYKFYMKFE